MSECPNSILEFSSDENISIVAMVNFNFGINASQMVLMWLAKFFF